jgi:hypothetical protein
VNAVSTRKSEVSKSQEREGLGVPVERGSTRRDNPAEEHRHWHSRRIPERVGRAKCGRFDSAHHQSSNPDTSSETGRRRGVGQALSGTGTARDFSRAVTRTWGTRRPSEVVLDAVCLRGLSEELDSSTLALLPASRLESGGCRGVAKDPSFGARNQGQDPEHNECEGDVAAGRRQRARAAIAASHTQLWLASGWGCRGRRLSKGEDSRPHFLQKNHN